MLNKIKDLFLSYRSYLILGNCFISIFLLITCIGLIIHSSNIPTSSRTTEQVAREAANTEEEEVKPDYFYVDIKGAVVRPGVFKMKSDQRVIDVVTRAGGLLRNADTNLINLSRELEDGMVIIIYTREEVRRAINTNTGRKIDNDCICPDVINDACLNPDSNQNNNTGNNTTSGGGSNNNNNNVNALININTADQALLETLPGIGAARAQDIINFRRGSPFITIEDIKKVSGIGDAIFARIKDLITV